MIEQSLSELREEIADYALNVEKMIEKSIKGLLQKKIDILKEVIERDEVYANEEEIKIEEKCISIIAKYGPKARFLREVLMILKLNNDLERMADHAVNIAVSSIFLIKRPQLKPYIDLPQIAEETIKMLKHSINSFSQENAQLARSVCERDDIIDNLRDQITRELITYMASDPSTIERVLQIIKITQNIERGLQT